jgi:hypothetical protein
VAVGGSVLEFASDDLLATRAVQSCFHAASASEGRPTHRYRFARAAGGWQGEAPGRPPFGPASLEDVFAFLEWRATEDVLVSAPPNRVFLHAAGIQVGGRAVLITGPAGSGKSTMTAHLMAQGGLAWGDDVVCFAPETGHFSAFPRSWKLDHKALSEIDLLYSTIATATWGTLLATSVWYVSPAAIRRAWEAPPGHAATLLILDGHHEGPPVVERMSEGRAALQVGAAMMAADAGRLPDWSAVMGRMLDALSDVVAWRLAGGPPAALAHAVQDALAA